MRFLLIIFIFFSIYIYSEGVRTEEEKKREIETWLEAREKKKPLKDDVLYREQEKIKSSVPVNLSLNQAISSTLKKDWEIDISEKEVVKQSGIYQRSKGPFNPVVGVSLENQWLLDVQTFGFKSSKDGNAQSVNFFLEKLARLGTRYAVDLKINREFNPSLLFNNIYDRTNEGSLSFSLEQPLLRRLKYNPEAVEEKVTELEVHALKNDFVQTMSAEVRTVVNLYWEVVAAKRNMEVQETSIRILEGLADSTQKLIEGGKLALSELNEQFAEIERAKKDYIRSIQNLYLAYNDLLFQMGEERVNFNSSPPKLILEDFPKVEVKKEDWDIHFLLNFARNHRGDLLAIRERIDETILRIRSAQNATLPTLDLRLGVDIFNTQINNRAKPFFSFMDNGPPEKDLKAEIRFSYPLFNDEAKGERRAREAEKFQLLLEETQLREQIFSDIATAYRNQLELIDEIKFADSAVEWYVKALTDEILRFKEGYSSLFIIIDFENRLTRTSLEQVQVYKEYAQNLVNLLFLTGSLINLQKGWDEVCIDPLFYRHLLCNPMEAK